MQWLKQSQRCKKRKTGYVLYLKIRLSIVLFCALSVSAFASPIIYVDDDDATGLNDGTSWNNAFVYLQDALTAANAAEKPIEIRIAQGIYKPNEGANVEGKNFHLINNVTLSGGYAGFAAQDPNARNIELYETILSGDREGNDIVVKNPRDLLNEPTRSDNHGPVIMGDATNQTAVLDGFIITGGCSRAVPFTRVVGGGGMKIDSGSPTIRNCTFTGNAALVGGGGMLNRSDSKPNLRNCRFIDNYARNGGGVYNLNSSPIFSHCFFEGNYSASYGHGGGIYNFNDWEQGLEYSCNSKFVECIFSGNCAGFDGGGVFFSEGCNSTIVNCTFYKNIGRNGRALSCDSNYIANNIKLTNCILWDGGNEIYNPESSEITINYTNLFGGAASIHDPCNAVIWGKGNIYENPLFVDPGYWADADDPNIVVEPNDPNAVWIDGDYHLKSQASRWDPKSQSWIQDDVTSPCIDVGDPNSPIGHESFPNGGIINMGAYGGTVEASKSYFGKPVCETIIAGDINGDCKVDFDDLMILMAHWLEDYTPQQ